MQNYFQKIRLTKVFIFFVLKVRRALCGFLYENAKSSSAYGTIYRDVGVVKVRMKNGRSETHLREEDARPALKVIRAHQKGLNFPSSTLRNKKIKLQIHMLTISKTTKRILRDNY